MVQSFILKDNTVDVYIPITPIKPQIGYIHKEESQQFPSREYNYDGVNNITATSTVNTQSEVVIRKALTSEVKDIPTNSANSATDYIGVVKYNTPYIIDEAFAEFTLMDMQANSITSLQIANIESLTTPLYEVSDSNQRIVSLFNGLQMLRIPANRFNILTSSPITKNYGKYYIKVSSKYIETPIINITPREQDTWQNVDPTYSHGRRLVMNCNNASFSGTSWWFESAPNKQCGRLHGSIVEIWDSSGITKKQTKVSVENRLGLDGSSGIASFVITPDVVGYDSPSQVASVGDLLRVYPRETYFDPIYIEVDYQNKDLDLESLIKFLKNDAVQNLKTGVIEIYDEAGVVVDDAGNVNGTVIQAYQIQKGGSGSNITEIRKKINL